jgi:hypothetical protein
MRRAYISRQYRTALDANRTRRGLLPKHAVIYRHWSPQQIAEGFEAAEKLQFWAAIQHRKLAVSVLYVSDRDLLWCGPGMRHSPGEVDCGDDLALGYLALPLLGLRP